MRRVTILMVLVLVVSACGGEDDVPAAGGTTVGPTTSTTIPSTTTTTRASTTTTTRAATTTTVSRDRLIEVSSADILAIDGTEVWVASIEGDWLQGFDSLTRESVALINRVCGPNFDSADPDDQLSYHVPRDVEISEDRVWVSCGAGWVVVIDRATHEVAATIDVESSGPISVLGDAVWIAQPRLFSVAQIDPVSLQVSRQIDLAHCRIPEELVAVGEVLWVVAAVTSQCGQYTMIYGSSRLLVIDPIQETFVWEASDSNWAGQLAGTDGEVWTLTSPDGDSVAVWDAATGEFLAEVNLGLDRGAKRIAAFGNHVWVINNRGQREGGVSEVVLIDRLGRQVLERFALERPVAVAAYDNQAWVLYEGGVVMFTPSR